MMTLLYDTVAYLRQCGVAQPDTVIILGTGQSALIDKIEVVCTINYADIPNFPVATVEFHKGLVVYGMLNKHHVLIWQGRFHYYEGYSMEQIVMPVRVSKLLGAKQLILSNAAGALRADLLKGDLVLVDDHINLQTDNPLRGQNLDALGPRFPDMSRPYDQTLNKHLKEAAEVSNLVLKTGVYAAVNGPNLETRAEYRFLRTIGADLVGMSTVPEVIAANHAGLPCAVISVVTDECDPDNLEPVSISEIIAVANSADKLLAVLLEKALLDLPNSNKL